MRGWKFRSERMRPSLEFVLLKPNKTFDLKGRPNKYHIWNGIDALCFKYSKHGDHCGGFRVVNYDENSYYNTLDEGLICKNCLKHEKEEYNKIMQEEESRYD
tara:strand:+ start:2043 stop:2348 length:306 start_codon:yes stop_codon:yes gene_type:complete